MSHWEFCDVPWTKLLEPDPTVARESCHFFPKEELIMFWDPVRVELVYRYCVVTAAVIAFITVPAMIVVYRLLLIKRRTDDLLTNLWNAKSIETYIDLFMPPEGAAPQKNSSYAELSKVAKEVFLQIHSWKQYGIPFVVLTVLIAIVVIVSTLWFDAKLHNHGGTIGTIPEPIIMALVGAYVWSVYEILSRIHTRDLTPDDLGDIALRPLTAIPIGYTFSLFAASGLESSFSFVAAAFPLRDVRMLLRKSVLKKLDQSLAGEDSPHAGTLASVIDGMGPDTIARLQELQVNTYVDLAYTDPIRLMARTGYSLRQVLVWLDQALLVVYTFPFKDKLVSAGLPCAQDASEFYVQHCLEGGKERLDASEQPAVVALAQKLDMPGVLVPEFLRRIHKDPHVEFLLQIWSEPEPATPQLEPSAKPKAAAAGTA